MIIITAYMEEREEYRDLRKIFERSAATIMPDIDIVIVEIPSVGRKGLDHHTDTSICFRKAAEKAIELGEKAAICDIDLMFRKRIDDVFDHQFDIAITIRALKARYNTGLWFYNPSSAAREFVFNWLLKTEKYTEHFKDNIENVKKYAGIDQFALACTIWENKQANVLTLPCQEWNAEQSTWKHVNEETRVIHIKSQLRNELFGRPQNMKYNGVISKGLEIIPECKELAMEAKEWLNDNPPGN